MRYIRIAGAGWLVGGACLHLRSWKPDKVVAWCDVGGGWTEVLSCTGIKTQNTSVLSVQLGFLCVFVGGVIMLFVSCVCDSHLLYAPVPHRG